MPIELSNDILLQVVGGKQVDTPTRTVFNSIAIDAEQVRGGELYIVLSDDAITASNSIDRAIERGAALVLTSNNSLFDNHPSNSVFILVEDTLQALIELGVWWYQRFNPQVFLVISDSNFNYSKEFLAAILLQQSRGIYALDQRADSIAACLCLCRLGAEDQWLIFEADFTSAAFPVFKRLLERISLTAVLLNQPAENQPELMALLDSWSLAKPLHVLASEQQTAWLASQSTAASQIMLSCFGTAEDCFLRLSASTSLGLLGSKVTFTCKGSNLELTIKQIGATAVRSAALALSAALVVNTNFTLPKMKMAIERVPIANQSARAVKVQGDRYIAVFPVYSATSLSELREHVELSRSQKHKLVFILPNASSHLSDFLVSIRPDYLINYGQEGTEVGDACRAVGSKVFDVTSPETSAHTAVKLSFDQLFILSDGSPSIETLSKLLIDHLGEVIELPNVGQ